MRYLLAGLVLALLLISMVKLVHSQTTCIDTGGGVIICTDGTKVIKTGGGDSVVIHPDPPK